MIIITGFENKIILKFSLTKKVNCHSECYFELLASDDYGEYLDKLNSELIVINEEEDLFRGYIDNVAVEPDKRLSEAVVKIHAFSYSKLIDITPKQRIFQNPEKDFNGIINIIKEKSKSEISCSVNEKIPYPILQNNETDFNFLLRLAKTFGYSLYIDDIEDKRKTGRINIYKYSDSSEKIEEKPDKVKYSTVSTDKNKKTNILELVLNEQYINIGRIVKYDNYDFKGYVAEIRIELDKHNLYKYHYVLYDLESSPDTNDDIQIQTKCVALKAVVTDNNDSENKGRIRVKFDCSYEDAEPDKQMWVNWQTSYMAEKGGFIFVPDKGDVVEIIYNDNEFTATQIIARKSLDEKFKNVKDKYIANIFGRMIVFKEKELELISGENKIVMKDDSILLQIKDKSKILIKENEIKLNAGNTSMTLGDDFKLSSGKITAKGDGIDLDGKSGNITLKGSKIYLN